MTIPESLAVPEELEIITLVFVQIPEPSTNDELGTAPPEMRDVSVAVTKVVTEEVIVVSSGVSVELEVELFPGLEETLSEAVDD